MTKLFIDCQVLQTPDLHRGRGQYSLCLLRALIDACQGRGIELIGIFNSRCMTPALDRILRDQLGELASVHLPLATPTRVGARLTVHKAMDVNRQTIREYVFKSQTGDGDAFLILSAYLEDASPVFPDLPLTKGLVCYDVIPHLFHQRYAAIDGYLDDFYYPNCGLLYEADLVLAISETTADDLTLSFGVRPSAVRVIGGAAISRQETPDASGAAKEIGRLVEQRAGFVLFPSGDELRKNNDRAIKGFELFRALKEPDVTLIISSHFSEDSIRRLRPLGRRVEFVGQVSGSTMNWLFTHCRAVVFASEYEGLGLPLLEAVETGASIACSDIPVFREIDDGRAVLFDPSEPESIAMGIEQAYYGSSRPPHKRDEFSWAVVASRVLSTVVDRQAPQPRTRGSKRRRVAVFTPVPSGFSAIGKVVAESHGFLSERFDVTYFVDYGPSHNDVRPDVLKGVATYRSAKEFGPADVKQYDGVIYHIGNSEYHMNTMRVALSVPGVAVVHDTYLGGLYKSMLDYGFISKSRYSGEAQLEELLAGRSGAPIGERSAMHGETGRSWLSSLVNNQIAVVAHSEVGMNRVEASVVGCCAVTRANLPVTEGTFGRWRDWRRSERVAIGLAGIVVPAKGTRLIERICASPDFDACNIVVCGYVSGPVFPSWMARRPNFSIVANPSDFEFQRTLCGLDIVINYREEYNGEASLTTLEAMRAGAAVVVRDVGWYGELPDAVVVKVSSAEDALAAVKALAADRDQAERIGSEAMDYVRDCHSHAGYVAALELASGW